MAETPKSGHPGFPHTARAKRLYRALRALLLSRMSTYLVIAVGLSLQLVLLWLAGELLDLYISAVELWTELATKHLEIVLSQ